MRRLLIALALVLLAVPALAGPLLQLGGPFPEIPLPSPADPAARAYLGLPEGVATFTLSQVAGDVVLVEILNVLCPHCQRQTKPYNELYRRLQKAEATRGRVKPVGGRRVFTAVAETADGQERFFAEVVSRASICDVCHDVHFIYVFDQGGKIVDFAPLHLTKYGNVVWDGADVTKMRQRVVGQYLRAPRPFDPKVDAVTKATMTSAIIFDQLALGEELMQQLAAQGLLW